MTDKLPPNLLALFQPRPPLRYLPHPDHASEERRTRAIEGVGGFLAQFQEYQQSQPPVTGESWFERKARKKAEKKEAHEQQVTKAVEHCQSPYLCVATSS